MIRKQKQKKDVEKQKKMNVLKNMYFNWFLMIRYFFAIFLFSNFYWALFTKGTLIMVVPIAMLLLGIKPSIENIRCYGEKHTSMKWTKLFYQIQLGMNACLMVLVWTGLFREVFPFLNGTLLSRFAIFGVLLVGFALAYSCVVRLIKIQKNEDRYFAVIQSYEKSLQLHL